MILFARRRSEVDPRDREYPRQRIPLSETSRAGVTDETPVHLTAGISSQLRRSASPDPSCAQDCAKKAVTVTHSCFFIDDGQAPWKAYVGTIHTVGPDGQFRAAINLSDL